MEYLGKSPNGLNQLSSSLVGLFVSGSKIVDFSSASVNVVGSVTASGIQAYEIDSFGNLPLEIKSNTQITGSLAVSSSISSSLFRGDGSGLFNLSAGALGDLNQIKSGSATATISRARYNSASQRLLLNSTSTLCTVGRCAEEPGHGELLSRTETAP